MLIQNLFSENVQKDPLKIAIASGEHLITYEELDKRSNWVANTILAAELPVGSLVGIFVQDRVDLITIMLGVLKSGYTFVSFNLHEPEEKLQKLCDLLDLQMVFAEPVHQALLSSLLNGSQATCLIKSSEEMLLDAASPAITETCEIPYLTATLHNIDEVRWIAGTAKGLEQFIRWEIEAFNIRAGFKMAQVNSPAHDVFLAEVLAPLCAGGTVCIPRDGDTRQLVNWLKEVNVNLIHCMPAMLQLIEEGIDAGLLTADHCSALQHIVMLDDVNSATRFAAQSFQKCYETFEKRVRLYCTYGQPETTIFKTCCQLKAEDLAKKTLPIGTVIKGARVLILDDNLQLCERGATGEIYIRTPYRASGYYRDPALTTERFIANPFTQEPTDCLFKTGDCGRWLNDKQIEYMGRNNIADEPAEEGVNVPLRHVPESDYYPASSAQKRMFVLNQLAPEDTNYNIPMVLITHGGFDRARFAAALDTLAQRHESFRTSFTLVDGEPVQKISPRIDCPLCEVVIDEQLSEDVLKRFVLPFDLMRAPLWRVTLLGCQDQTAIIFDLHHIIFDGASTPILLQDFISIYAGVELPEPRLQYRDFSVWQQLTLQTKAHRRREQYWLETFQGELPVLNLPTDYPRPLEINFAGSHYHFTVEETVADGLKRLAVHNGSTLYLVLLAAYNILLGKYTQATDIVTGTPVSGRAYPGLEGIIGMFADTLALRNYPTGEKTFLQFLAEVRENTLRAFENQDYPFEMLVEKLAITREVDRNPLFDTMFALGNLDLLQSAGMEAIFTPFRFDNKTAKFDLTLRIEERAHGLFCELEYRTRLFAPETIKRLAGHFLHILQQVTANPASTLDKLELVTREEKQQLLAVFNHPETALPARTIQQIFEERVRENPVQIATVFKGAHLTYGELNVSANQLAYTLRHKGVKPETIVGIMLEPALEVLAGMLGILKSGGAFLLIDPDHPVARIEYMLKDGGVQILLTQRHLIKGMDFAGEMMYLEEEDFSGPGASDAQALENPAPLNQPHDLAYVIYTSGTTGEPNGVMIEHRALLNFSLWHSAEYGVSAADRISKYAGFGFDATIFEIFPYITAGATIHFIPKEMRLDLQALNHYFEENDITVAFLPTQLAEQFMVIENHSLRMLLTGGDKLKIYHPQSYQVINNYGPTENTVVATHFIVQNNHHNIPIGKPVVNTQIYIINAKDQLQPIGVPGELCISGASLFRGYVNRASLTAQKLTPNPFLPGTLMYRTGDLARWLPDGNLEFAGRKDLQVKIRGFRIEPGEIEAQLRKIPVCKDVAVIDLKDSDGQAYLVAYLVLEGDWVIEEIKAYLAQVVPEYMIPAHFIRLESIPLTTSGKVDRRALPEPERTGYVGREYAAPTNSIEERLAHIWGELLNVEQIGIHDHFFELGGHSLKATTLAARVAKEFQIELPLREIFQKPVLKDLAQYINLAGRDIYRAIEPVAKREYYPVSSAQKRLFILHQFDNASTNYNISGKLAIEGELDRTLLERSFQQLVQRHESLRTSFHMVNGEVMQKVHDSLPLTIEFLAGNEQGLAKLAQEFVRPFDLSEAPLLRLRLIQLPERYILLYDMHHVISDGISVTLMISDLVKLYQGAELPALKLQYKDYAAWQNQFLTSEKLQLEEQYWLATYTSEIPALDIPADHPRPPVMTFAGGRVEFQIDNELRDGLYALAVQNGATLYMVLLAVYSLLLSRYTGIEDIIVGSPIAGRPHGDLENIIGMFVNTLALRNYPIARKTFTAFLHEVKNNSLRAFENQDYPFEKLVEKLELARDLSRNPLFDTMFVLQNFQSSDLRLPNLRIIPESLSTDAKFDLTLNAMETAEGITLNLVYRTALFKQQTVERLQRHLQNLLRQVVQYPEYALQDLDLLDASERYQVLYGFNDTVSEIRFQTLHEIFQEQARHTPKQLAIVSSTETYTYAELKVRVNQLARRLREKGVHSDEIVGIMVDRSPAMIIGILGILEAGGAYMPIDPNYPAERIAYMLKESQTRILLTSHFSDGTQMALTNLPDTESSERKQGISSEDLRPLSQETGSTELEIISLDDATIYAGDGSELESINNPDDLAYVLYTSGSTGRPKGVMVEHYSVVNTLTDMQNKYPLGQGDVILQSTVYTFDASVREIFWWFFNGATCYLLDVDGEKYPAQIVEIIARQRITVAKFVPLLLAEVLKAAKEMGSSKLAALKYLFVGGEALTSEVVDLFLQVCPAGETKLVNVYGPSEMTIHCTDYPVTGAIEKNYAPLGKPIANTHLYVLDRGLNPLPVGVYGEIYATGAGVARGYVHMRELTAERFLINPFNDDRVNVEPAGVRKSEPVKQIFNRMYKTGDLGRWTAGGNLEYIGRVDYQVKIRGYRIELGEVESQLLQHPAVQEVVVSDRLDRSAGRYLCAYIVSLEEVSSSDLRAYLQGKLPEYMIPAYFVQLERLPLTSNGKINRRALPEPLRTDSKEDYLPPTNDLEKRLAEIWSEVLGVQRVGSNDNFFELGGHSLKATVLVARVFKEFGVELSLREVFRKPVLHDLAETIRQAEKSFYSTIKPVEKRDFYPVSSAQKRLFILNQFAKDNTTYNMPRVMYIEEPLDQGAFELAVQRLMQRHDSLRTSFSSVNGEIVQIIHDTLDFQPEYAVASEETIPELLAAFVQPFDLSAAPLLRIKLVQLLPESGRYILMFDMHHIVSDGISMNLLVQDFRQLYQGQALPPLLLQYKDFAVWQQDFLASEQMHQEEEYWSKTLSGALPVLDWPGDFPRPAVLSFEGAELNRFLPVELTAKLQQLAAKQGVTLYMVLLAAYNILLAKYSGLEDIIIGTPIAGRPRADLENIIGLFVNTLALRNYPAGGKTFVEFLSEVKERTLEAFENQDYQFEMLLNKLDVERDLSRNPLFDHVFAMQKIEQIRSDTGNVQLAQHQYQIQNAKFDLSLYALEVQGELQLALEYRTRIFVPETMERLLNHYENTLDQLVANPELMIDEIEIITTAEKRWILEQFNDTQCAEYRGSVLDLFAEQVLRNPEHPAVVHRDRSLTYRELDEKSTILARTLQAEGVGREQIVGILADPSVEMFIAILAVSKAGGAYLPIDPKYPARRIEFMLEDSGSNIFLTQRHLAQKILFGGKVFMLDDPALYMLAEELIDVPELQRPEISPADLAYVIYTSGSTGQPKGVLIEHHSLLNLTLWSIEYYQLTPADRGSKYAGPSFDASVLEVFPFFCAGATIHAIDEELRHDLHKLNSYFMEHQISVSFLPTPAGELFMKLPNTSLRILIVGGDKLKTYQETAYQVNNIYGPTENTVITTNFNVDRNYHNIPIGKPLSNTQVLILGRKDQLQPIGIPGELCISGTGLAREYLNNPELTCTKFTLNPFTGARMYRTGDLARWLPDGNLEFLGRIDQQVKLRGYRIELGEIENQLIRYAGVHEAAVTLRKDPHGDDHLVAYLVLETTNGVQFEEKGLKEFLSALLPEYMLPAYFIQLEALPRDANGKIDRRALPAPDHHLHLTKSYEAPATQLEATLASIWGNILGIEQVSVTGNFFELGGHSLKATAMVTQIFKECHVEVPVGEVFKHPTIRDLAQAIELVEKKTYFTIKPVAKQEYYPVSAAQRRLFVLSQLEDTGTVYNVPQIMTIEGGLDLGKLEATLAKLIQRHESLRTSFHMVKSTPEIPDGLAQRVHDQVDFAVQVYAEVGAIADSAVAVELAEVADLPTVADLAGAACRKSGVDDPLAVERIIHAFIRPFDLNHAPLFRVGVIRRQSADILLIDMHHIISDGVSVNLLVEELLRMYQGHDLPQLKIQYKDFTVWQTVYFASDEFKQQEEYWLQRFADEIPMVNLPIDNSGYHPALRSFRGSRFEFAIDEKLTAQLQDMARKAGVTLYMLLLAAFNVLLSAYAGQDDIIIGSPIAGRPHADLERIIGMFVNTLALRNFPAGEKTFSGFLQEVKATTLGAYDHQNYPFDMLVNKLDLPGDISRNPLFDTVFSFHNSEEGEKILDGLEITPYPWKNLTAKFDLTLHTVQLAQSLQCAFEYRVDLFRVETIGRMSNHLINILQSILADPGIALGRIELLGAEERAYLLHQIHQTDVSYPHSLTIQQIFEEQVQHYPESIAVVYEGESITYRKLNEAANQLARFLRANGVQADSVVGIMLDRSIDLLIGIMATLKAGGAYLPIDPGYPEERVHYILEDSGCQMLLTRSECLDNLDFRGLTIDLPGADIYTGDNYNLPALNEPRHLAYIIYTSGSTGQPKGVMVEHGNVVRLFYNDRFQFDFSEVDVWTMFHSQCFDFSVWEIFGALLYGGKLVVVPKETAQYPARFRQLLQEQQVTVLNQTPTAFYNLSSAEMQVVTSDLQLRYVIFGGEALKPALLKPWKDKYPKTRLINMYGITETTVHVTFKEITLTEIAEKISNLGQPIPTLQVYIMDQYSRLLPRGVLGEICVAGKGVARGYLNRPELTAEKFIANPYITGERLYRSGDLGKLLPNGDIEYLGRIDRQVKIRGFRIELGEIENQLLKYPTLKDTVVVDREDGTGEKLLVAYVVFSETKEVNIADVRKFLAASLPEYMVPALFMPLAALPLTVNGKVDLKALPTPEGQRAIAVEYVAPANAIEERLALIWSSILGVEGIGVHDNFFELGGHSLRATTLASKIYDEFNVEITLRQVFRTPTIRELAREISQGQSCTQRAIPRIQERAYYPLSAAQKRLFFVNQLDVTSISYNMPGIYTVEGDLDRERFTAAFQAIVARHETLRTSFSERVAGSYGDPVQVVHPAVSFNVAYAEYARPLLEEEIPGFTAQFVRPFDLSQAPLLRVSLNRFANGYLIMLDMHHIISDGLSIKILMEEFISLYRERQLPELKIQYKDYAVWQEKLFIDGGLQEEEGYWLQKLKGFEFTSFPGLKNMLGDAMGQVRVDMGAELYQKLGEFAGRYQVTKFILMLAVFKTVLAKKIDQEDVTIGMPISGRNKSELENLIGLFLNVLLIRSQVNREMTFAEYLLQLTRTVMEAYEHQTYPFDQLYFQLKERELYQGNELFSILFNYLPLLDSEEMAVDGQTIKSHSLQQFDAKYDITLYVTEGLDTLHLRLVYRQSKYEDFLMEKFLKDFMATLELVLNNEQILLKEIDFTTPNQSVSKFDADFEDFDF